MATTWGVMAGHVPYEVAWEWQRALVEARVAGAIPDVLLLLEHPHTYTLGRGARPGHILMDPEERRRWGVEVYPVERGGDVTYHGPGQLVGYPIVSLHRRGKDVHRFLRDLEEVLLRTLADYGLSGHREPGLTGVWAGAEKVAAIGVAFRRWVSYHGFALNVDPDMRFFGGIIPCGISDRGVTSLRRLLGDGAPGMDEVAGRVVAHFADVFEADVVMVGLEQLQPALGDAATFPLKAGPAPRKT